MGGGNGMLCCARFFVKIAHEIRQCPNTVVCVHWLTSAWRAAIPPSRWPRRRSPPTPSAGPHLGAARPSHGSLLPRVRAVRPPLPGPHRGARRAGAGVRGVHRLAAQRAGRPPHVCFISLDERASVACPCGCGVSLWLSGRLSLPRPPEAASGISNAQGWGGFRSMDMGGPMRAVPSICRLSSPAGKTCGTPPCGRSRRRMRRRTTPRDPADGGGAESARAQGPVGWPAPADCRLGLAVWGCFAVWRGVG